MNTVVDDLTWDLRWDYILRRMGDGMFVDDLGAVCGWKHNTIRDYVRRMELRGLVTRYRKHKRPNVVTMWVQPKGAPRGNA